MSKTAAPLQPESPLLDPTALRIPTAARNSEQRKQQTLDLRIDKPGPDDWVFVHPDEAFRWEGFSSGPMKRTRSTSSAASAV